jgi:uncharacterized protein (UPF0305 family)
MRTPVTELKRCIEKYDLKAIETEREDAEFIRAKVKDRYVKGVGGRLFERILDFEVTWDDDRHDWLMPYLGEREFLVFWDSRRSRSMFRFTRGREIVVFLENSALYTTYITNEDASFLVVCTSECCMIAAGGAEAWLSSLIDD